MATSSDDMKKGFSYRRYKDGASKHRPFSQEIFQASWTHKCPTYVHRTPPCQGSCPSGHDIRGWLDIVRGIEKPAGGMSMQEYAFRRNTDANPFPAIMGRVCPAPCEDGCNRNQVDDHVEALEGLGHVPDPVAVELLRLHVLPPDLLDEVPRRRQTPRRDDELVDLLAPREQGAGQ